MQKSKISYTTLIGIIFLTSGIVPFFLENKLLALAVWMIPVAIFVIDKQFRKEVGKIYRNFWKI